MAKAVGVGAFVLLGAFAVGLYLLADRGGPQSFIPSDVARSPEVEVGNLKAWEKKHFPTGFVKYTVTTKTLSNGQTRAGLDVEITGRDENGVQAVTAWHTLRESGNDAGVLADALDEFELMDRNVGKVESVRFRLTDKPTDDWRPDWVEVAVGEYPCWDIAHFEPMERVCDTCGNGVSKRATPYTLILKIRDEADAGRAGPFEIRFKYTTPRSGQTSTDSRFFALTHDFVAGETVSFKWFYYSPEELGDIKSLSLRKKGVNNCANRVCPDVEWVDLRVGEEKPGQIIYVGEVAKDKCENVPTWYCDMTSLVKRVKWTEEEDVFHLQQQIDVLRTTVNQLTYKTLWKVENEGFATYTITFRTSDSGQGQMDIKLVGALASTEWLRVAEDGLKKDEVDTFEYRTAWLGDLKELRVRSNHWDGWKAYAVEVRLGSFPFWEEHHFTSTGAASKDNELVMDAPTTQSHNYKHSSEDVLVKLEGDKRVLYTIIVQTKTDGASVHSVDVQLVGTKNSAWLRLADPGVGFQNSEQQVFEIRTGMLGPLTAVNVRVGDWDDWKWEYIKVYEGSYPFWDEHTFAEGRAWKDGGVVVSSLIRKNTYHQIESLQQTSDELTFKAPVVADPEGLVQYTITAATRLESWAGSKNGDIKFTLVGDKGESKVWTMFDKTEEVKPADVITKRFEDKYVGKMASLKIFVEQGGHWCPSYVQVGVGNPPQWELTRYTPIPNSCIEKDGTTEVKRAVQYDIKITPRTAKNSADGWSVSFRPGSDATGTWSPWVPVPATNINKAISLTYWHNGDWGGPEIWEARIKNNNDAGPMVDVSELEISDGKKTTRFHVPELYVDSCDPNICYYSSGRGPAGAKMSREVVTARTGEDDGVTSEVVQKMIDGQKGAMAALARASINTQFGLEQQTMAVMGSGVTKVRAFNGGGESYMNPTFGGRASFLSIHEHANNQRTIGMGEFSAIMNGVFFQTRHNDYGLRQPSLTESTLGATSDIEFPEVPPAVTSKGSVSAQIAEMQEWFRAWKNQDHSVRDYRPYFKPTLCYLEAYWKKHDDGSFAEPFASDRHHVEASSWADLYGKIMYLWNSGRKNNDENLPYLPMAVKAVDADGLPVFAEFTYRILCHPLSKDVPLNRFRVAHDFHTKMATGQSWEGLELKRNTRFELNQRDQDAWHEGFQTRGFLDELMEEIPGLNNYNANLQDSSFGIDVNTFDGSKKMNVGYYSRYYAAATNDAMGRSQRRRAFNDPFMWAAMNTQSQVMGLKANQANKGQAEDLVEQKWSWAIPLEIIYMTPLLRWNPYGLVYQGKAGTTEGDVATNGGRDGSTTNTAKAYQGTNSKVYYQTPAEFYDAASSGGDAADTAKGSVGVLRGNSIKIVRPSGTRIVIQGVGNGVGDIRTRWPIAPVAEFGSTTWKEVKALADHLLDPSRSYGVEFALTSANGHQHLVNFAPEDLLRVEGNLERSATSTTNAGHTHTVTLKRRGAGATACESGWKAFNHKEVLQNLALCFKMTLEEGHGLKCESC